MSVDFSKLRIAIVHYWFIDARGGEKVVEALCELFPNADIFTHIFDFKTFSNIAARHTVKTSFIQRLPFAGKAAAYYLPLMPLASEQFDLSAYDLVISSESGPAKALVLREDCVHICYCHSPMRYIWNQYAENLGWTPALLSWPMQLSAHYLRLVDYASAARVDHFIANSTSVARRIQKYYRRPSTVIFPPVEVSAFSPADKEDFYLYCGQLTPYKRPDLAIDCFNELGLPLRVIGDGEMRGALRKRAKPNIRFLGRVDDGELRRHLARCCALVFPGEEDFGIVTVEAMACGRPVIAYGRGGVLDTVIDGITGVLFTEQSLEGLAGAVRRYQALSDTFDPQAIARHAGAFDKPNFMRRITELIQGALQAELASQQR